MSDFSSPNGKEFDVRRGDDGVFVTLYTSPYAILEQVPRESENRAIDANGKEGRFEVIGWNNRFLLSPTAGFMKDAAYPIQLEMRTSPAVFFCFMAI